MRVRKTSRKGTGRAAIALVAACAIGAVTTPLAIAVASQETAAEAAADGGPDDLLLPTPEAPRISDSAYAGFQRCGAASGDPVVTSGSPTLAATLESVAPPGTVEPAQPGPRRKVVFEVDTAAGEQVVHKQLTSDTSHDAAFQLPEGTLGDGAYRWRTRVKDGGTVSQWTAWCSFTVERR
ncbi:hypothetical protein [Streptomyces vilmorinianum]|uniref:hypothetical protein n=1 Tax=Streptomyces vilmorinianum TaxID=3051092 RepID=UPI0010FB540A|nr:hypothetical protein [Streptomyces vilmorinianum]